MRKLPLPPPEDDDGNGLQSVVAMYDFTAKEDTDLTIKQVLSQPPAVWPLVKQVSSKGVCSKGVCMSDDVDYTSTGGGVHHTAQTGSAVVACPGQTWVHKKKKRRKILSCDGVTEKFDTLEVLIFIQIRMSVNCTNCTSLKILSSSI